MKRPKRSSATSNVVYIGVDPGKSGGLVALLPRPPDPSRTSSGNYISSIIRTMPATERDVWDWFRRFVDGDGRIYDAVAVIEKVGGYMGPGTEGPGSAMFNFGWGYGGLRMAMTAAGIPFEEVPPQKWQQALGISPRKSGTKQPTADKKVLGGESRAKWKNRLRAKAQQLFPSEEVTLATADALLIALYCKRKHEGTLG